MKKILLLTFILLGLSSTSNGSVVGQAYDFEVDGIYYSVLYEESKTVAVVCGNTEKKDTPAYVGPERDLMVYDYTSWKGNSYRGDVTVSASVRPDNSPESSVYAVSEIGVGAFYNCDALTSVTLPESLTKIDIGAFHGCSALEELTLPDCVEWVGPNAFQSCSSMKKLHFSLGCSAILSQTFFRCGTQVAPGMELSGVENVTSIGQYAFYGSGVRIYPNWEALTSIGYSAFDYSTIEEVSIPAALVQIKQTKGAISFAKT